MLKCNVAASNATAKSYAGGRMSEILVILHAIATPEQRKEIARIAPPVQSISERVFLAQGDRPLEQLRDLPGISQVFDGSEGAGRLPALDSAEALFAQAWFSSRGQKKRRIGEGLDWDTPPMTPPDPYPKK